MELINSNEALHNFNQSGCRYMGGEMNERFFYIKKWIGFALYSGTAV